MMRREELRIGDEIKIVPWWAWVLGAAFFIGIQLLFHIVVPTQKNPPPRGLLIPLGLLTGTVLFSLVLLIGYVNRDAKRRSMRSWAWTLLVIFVPNAIGFIIYFLLRQPLRSVCPQCGTAVEPGFNFCPKCHFNLTPTCPQCSRPVRHGDVYCPYCGTKLENAPVRALSS